MCDREIAIGIGEIFGIGSLGRFSALFCPSILSSSTRPAGREPAVLDRSRRSRARYGQHISDLLIHSLLVLGLWEQLADHRKKKAAEG